MRLNYVFDPKTLNDLAARLRDDYRNARPYPHIVIDDFLPSEALEAVLAEFPRPDQIDWITYKTEGERKQAMRSEMQMGDWTRFLLYQFNSSVYIGFLERLTGLAGLLPDPHFWGCGVHQIERGGFLKIHADYTRHPVLPLDRRVNVLLYLNKDWQNEYGGALELWDENMTRCEVSIAPIFNRCVIFNTTAFSFHGHPDPVLCPPGQTRKSLALYYFTNGRPEEEHPIDHGTLFVRRPGEVYREPRPGAPTRMQTVKRLAKRWIPPVLVDAIKGLR